MRQIREIEYKDFTLAVEYDYYKGFPGSREEPEEDPEIYIEEVFLVKDEKGFSPSSDPVLITNLLTEEQFKKIEEILWKLKED